MLLPYAQGLAELSVSDANKQHLPAIPGVIDSLRRGLGVSAPGSTDDALQKLRTLSASTLAQLAVRMPTEFGCVESIMTSRCLAGRRPS